MNITITSNGMNTSQDVLDAIVRFDNVVPVFSLQSMSELNQKLMGGDYHRTIETIEYLI